MNINYSFERPLVPQEVQRLLKQTSWASHRDIPGIEKMLKNSFLTLGVWDDDRLILRDPSLRSGQEFCTRVERWRLPRTHR